MTSAKRMPRAGLREIALVTVLLGISSPVSAAFEEQGAGARAPGMGNAFGAIADDVYAVHYNAAGLGTLERPELGVTYARLLWGLSDGSKLGKTNMAYAHPLRRGAWGTIGLSWDDFRLDSAYTERVLGLSYGRLAWKNPQWGTLFAGIQLKNLSRSFSPGGEADNAFDFGAGGRGTDPVLSGKKSQSTMAADIGLLFRTNRKLAFGLSVTNANQPNVGFAATEKLPMLVRLGTSYKSLWLNLAGELRQQKLATGKTGRELVFAGERFFPTLDHGEFGFRGSIGIGDADYREITTGLSYKINKIRADYAFMMPLGGVSGTLGTHRMGLSFMFGALSAEEELSRDLMTQMQRMKERAAKGEGYGAGDLGKPAALDAPHLAEIKQLIDRGEYLLAHQKLLRLMADWPSDSSLVHLGRRLDLIAAHYPDILNPEEKWEKALFSGCKSFIYGKDRTGMLQVAYAQSLAPKNLKIGKLLNAMEQATLIEAEKPMKGQNLLVSKQLKAQEAFAARDYQTALEEARDALEIEPEDFRALKRIGSSLYMLGHYPEAVATWEAALRYETNPAERSALGYYVKQARQAIASGKKPVEPIRQRRVRRIGPAGVQAVTGPLDARAIERLYQQGMEHYARGEMVLAQAAFERILASDPGNGQARKALERIRRSQE